VKLINLENKSTQIVRAVYANRRGMVLWKEDPYLASRGDVEGDRITKSGMGYRVLNVAYRNATMYVIMDVFTLHSGLRWLLSDSSVTHK
jgi:hypothetical protein